MTGHGSTDQVGDWRPATIETPDTRVVILPDLGARVTSLLDRRSGREWLAQGRLPETASAWTSEGAIFGGDQAFGWDECLPTVAACVADLGGEVPAALRDHGALWGRPADVQVEASRSTVTWRPETWPVELRRVIDLEGDDVSVRYRLTSHAPRALPFLWSMHPLLTLEPGTRIELPGVRHARLGGAIGVPLVAPASVPWPVTHGPDGPIDWSLVGERDAGIAAKLYVPAPPVARVVAPDGSTLELTWDRRFAPTLGVWVTYAGWHPDGPRVHQVALEPTTSADDDLATAIGEGRAVTVGPGTTVEWWVRIESRLTDSPRARKEHRIVTAPPSPGGSPDGRIPHRRPLVGILLFDEVEVLDFAGPYEVFSGTSDPDGDPYVDVLTVGPTREIACHGGLRVLTSHLVTDCPPLDALVVPGGLGADDRTPVQDAVLLPFLRERGRTTPTVASVCTGAFLLARAGLFEGRRATTHTQALPALRAEFPDLDVVGGKIVDEGPILSAAGVSSGIDLALHLYERWFGPEARERAATGLDGPWR